MQSSGPQAQERHTWNDALQASNDTSPPINFFLFDGQPTFPFVNSFLLNTNHNNNIADFIIVVIIIIISLFLNDWLFIAIICSLPSVSI